MKVFKYCLGIIALLSFVSCSNLGVNLPNYDDLLKAQTEQNGKACVRQRNIRGYGMFDNDVISINARGQNRYYLVTTLFRCHSLQTSFAAGFKGTFSELCGGGSDKIITSEGSCPIKSIFEFASREDAVAIFEKAEKIRQDLRNEAKEKEKEKEKDKGKEPSQNDKTAQ